MKHIDKNYVSIETFIMILGIFSAGAFWIGLAPIINSFILVMIGSIGLTIAGTAGMVLNTKKDIIKRRKERRLRRYSLFARKIIVQHGR